MRLNPTDLRPAFILSAMTLLGVQAGAQMPGTPTLQNAFANPGITAAVNVSSLGGASSYVAAGAWAPGSARFQLSAGIGAQAHSGASTRTVYGGRLNVPFLGGESNLGLSAFAGYGGVSGGGLDSSDTKTLIPVGATISFRHMLGSGHGISLYGSPVYEAVTRGGGAGSASILRFSVGLDFGVTSAIGATFGVEFGQKEDPTSGKPSGTSFGGALSYVIGGNR